jgi:DNA-binding Lrp family transcriptional regulator
MLTDASITQAKLKDDLNISESQISKRIQILKDKGIIRGYFIDFDLMKSEDFINFYFFLDMKDSFDQILSLFYQIPYPIMILVESHSRVCISMKLGAKDFNSFMKGFDLLKSHLNSYFFQLTHNQVKENPQYVFELFNKVSSQWETPIEDYISLL